MTDKNTLLWRPLSNHYICVNKMNKAYISIIFLIGCFKNGGTTDVSEIIARLDILEKNFIKRLEQKVKELETENGLLKNENKHIKEQLKSVTQTLNQIKLQQEIPTKKNHIPEERMSTESGMNEVNIGQNKIQTKNRNDKRLLAVPTQTPAPTLVVAFRALLSKTLSQTGVHQPIEYDQVPLNLGHGYDARHGHLVAPVKGVYLISVTASSNTGKRLVLDLVQNGNTVVILDTAIHTQSSSQTKTFPMLLEKGDMVWVRERQGYEGESLPSHHNMFSGVLLVPM